MEWALAHLRKVRRPKPHLQTCQLLGPARLVERLTPHLPQ